MRQEVVEAIEVQYEEVKPRRRSFSQKIRKMILKSCLYFLVIAFCIQGCDSSVTRAQLEEKTKRDTWAERIFENIEKDNTQLKKKVVELEKTKSSRSGQAIQKGSLSEIHTYINEYSKKYGVQENLVKAIIKQESGFDQKSISPAGAIGLMQLMPATAKSLGVDPYNAKENIDGGVKHLSYLMKSYSGNVELALAGYNAGSGNVAKYTGIPPFKETQDYVRKVTTYYRQYSLGVLK